MLSSCEYQTFRVFSGSLLRRSKLSPILTGERSTKRLSMLPSEASCGITFRYRLGMTALPMNSRGGSVRADSDEIHAIQEQVALIETALIDYESSFRV